MVMGCKQLPYVNEDMFPELKMNPQNGHKRNVKVVCTKECAIELRDKVMILVTMVMQHRQQL